MVSTAMEMFAVHVFVDAFGMISIIQSSAASWCVVLLTLTILFHFFTHFIHTFPVFNRATCFDLNGHLQALVHVL
jgi:hypothetical protein